MSESEFKEFMVYDVNEEGDLKLLDLPEEDLGHYLQPDLVFIILKQSINRIYLWKGAKSEVKKRFMGSRQATVFQGDLMKAGFKRCKVVSIDQGDEAEEFLNVFGLESMEVTEKIEDKRYVRNIEKEEQRIAEIVSTKRDYSGSDTTSKVGEIKCQSSSSFKLYSSTYKYLSVVCTIPFS